MRNWLRKWGHQWSTVPCWRGCGCGHRSPLNAQAQLAHEKECPLGVRRGAGYAAGGAS